jgi:hypothetical protein
MGQEIGTHELVWGRTGVSSHTCSFSTPFVLPFVSCQQQEVVAVLSFTMFVSG